MRYEIKLVIRLIVALLFVVIYPFFEKFLFYLTIYPSYFLINLFYDVSLVGNSLFLDFFVVDFIPACVAGLAYALLFFLIVFTKDLSFKTSVKMFLLGSLLILGMNLLRIFFLLVILVEFGSNLFDSVHIFFWTFVSGVYVAFVWIALVYLYKVKEIPVYSDVKYLVKNMG